MTLERGSAATRAFYDRVGWIENPDGTTVDGELFADKGGGRIRDEINRARLLRVRAALARAGSSLRLFEAGCGANPLLPHVDLCSRYVGSDFSATGLEVARKRLAGSSVPHDLLLADSCNLPLADGAFDAAYSAHVLYHIDEPAAQRKAFREIMRVVRSGGVAVFVMANPRPLLFWGQLARNLVLGAPGVPELLRRVKPRLPTRYQIPYRAMPVRWMVDSVRDLGEVEVTCYELTSTWFRQHVTEAHLPGRWFWETMRRMEGHAPQWLGCYLQLTVRKF